MTVKKLQFYHYAGKGKKLSIPFLYTFAFSEFTVSDGRYVLACLHDDAMTNNKKCEGNLWGISLWEWDKEGNFIESSRDSEEWGICGRSFAETMLRMRIREIKRADRCQEK